MRINCSSSGVREGATTQELPRLRDMKEVELSGRILAGGSNEEIGVPLVFRAITDGWRTPLDLEEFVQCYCIESKKISISCFLSSQEADRMVILIGGFLLIPTPALDHRSPLNVARNTAIS